MSTHTTLKHRLFVGEPMEDKAVTELPGIGEVLGNTLDEQGYDKAFVVLGQFLLFHKDVWLFTDWLKDISGANARQAALCSQCLKEWCENYI